MSAAVKRAPAHDPAAAAKKRKVFTPRPPRPAEERLPKLYHGLTDQVEGAHFDNAKKTCRKILTLDPKSIPAFQTLLFLCLQTDDYTTALDIVSNPPAGAGSLEFERAYCLYRLHREKEALAIVEKLDDRGRRVDHLEAQIRYRLGEYEKTQQLYDDLLASCDPSSAEHPDILTNLQATTAHTDFLSHEYHSYLSASTAPYGSSTQHVPTEGELESFVPSLPTGWASGSAAAGPSSRPDTKTATSAPAASGSAAGAGGKADGAKPSKPRHKLPKGAVEGKPLNEDPERWIPLRQRQSYITAQGKKKGVKESMGTGFTQGSTSAQSGGGGGGGGGSSGGGGGGGKNKKGKKK